MTTLNPSEIKFCIFLSSVQSLTHVQLSTTPCTPYMPGFPDHHQLLELAQTHVHQVTDAIQPSYPLPSVPFSFHLQSSPALGSFPMSQFFTLGHQSIRVSASTSVLTKNIQNWFSLGWLVGSPCSPRDSQESFPTPQFKSINSSLLSFLYSPVLTSIHDYLKNRSFD